LSRLTPQGVAGLFVLVAGLAVVYVIAVTPEMEPATEPVLVAPLVARVAQLPPPGLEGVDPAVERILYASGRAEAFRADQLTELPPEVARVLVFYRVTLTVPVTEGGDR
ncbi:MAG TPA: hypothetical protein VK990_05965, partial [Acidimicrobiia bacterium]|nr:hypothetical protein [Acidimicrobiia bacterium]